jgi:hypothetical protein
MIFLRFSTQFTKISKGTNTISVATLQSGPWEEIPFCNVVPGGAAGAAPAKFRWGPAAGLAGDVRGVVLGWLGLDLGARLEEGLPEGRAHRSAGGGCRGCLSGEVAARLGLWTGQRAMGRAGQGLGVLLGRASAPEARLDDDGVPGRAAAASRARGRSTASGDRSRVP